MSTPLLAALLSLVILTRPVEEVFGFFAPRPVVIGSSSTGGGVRTSSSDRRRGRTSPGSAAGTSTTTASRTTASVVVAATAGGVDDAVIGGHGGHDRSRGRGRGRLRRFASKMSMSMSVADDQGVPAVVVAFGLEPHERLAAEEAVFRAGPAFPAGVRLVDGSGVAAGVGAAATGADDGRTTTLRQVKRHSSSVCLFVCLGV